MRNVYLRALTAAAVLVSNRRRREAAGATGGAAPFSGAVVVLFGLQAGRVLDVLVFVVVLALSLVGNGFGLVGLEQRLGLPRADSRRQRPRIFDDIDVEVVGLGLLGHRDLHDDRVRGPGIVGVVVLILVLVLLLIGAFVLVNVVEVALLRLPVGVAAMSRGGTFTPEQTRTRTAVQYPGRQRDVAGAPHRVAFADQHRNQHKQPQHHQRDPQQRLGNAWHDDLLSSVPDRSMRPAQLHTCNLPITSTNGHSCHVSHSQATLGFYRVGRRLITASWRARPAPGSTSPIRTPLRR